MRKAKAKLTVKAAGVTRVFTARYTPIGRRFMGQIIEWPEVITEGKNLQDCRESLLDALREMILACRQLGEEVPYSEGLLEPIAVEV